MCVCVDKQSLFFKVICEPWCLNFLDLKIKKSGMQHDIILICVLCELFISFDQSL